MLILNFRGTNLPDEARKKRAEDLIMKLIQNFGGMSDDDDDGENAGNNSSDEEP